MRIFLSPKETYHVILMGIWILDQLRSLSDVGPISRPMNAFFFLICKPAKINFHIFRSIEQKIAWAFIMSSTFRLNTPRPVTMILRNKRFDKLYRENNLMAICRILCWLTQEKKKKCSQEFYIWKRKKKSSSCALPCLGKGYKKTHKQVYFYLTSQITNIKNIYTLNYL